MLIENLGNAVGFEQQFSTPGHAGKVDGFAGKKRPNFYQNQIWESNTVKERI